MYEILKTAAAIISKINEIRYSKNFIDNDKLFIYTNILKLQLGKNEANYNFEYNIDEFKNACDKLIVISEKLKIEKSKEIRNISYLNSLDIEFLSNFLILEKLKNICLDIELTVYETLK